MVDKLVDIARTVVWWLSSKPNRLRMRGARIEVTALILARNPAPSVLLARSAYKGVWMFPQEGVQTKEDFVSALRRCLVTECGLRVENASESLGSPYYLRSIRFVGVIPLPVERHGERLVADDAVGTPLENVRLKKKAHWLATVVIMSRELISPKPNGSEVEEIKWVGCEEARQLVRKTNRPVKAEFLVNCLDGACRDLCGHPPCECVRMTTR